MAVILGRCVQYDLPSVFGLKDFWIAEMFAHGSFDRWLLRGGFRVPVDLDHDRTRPYGTAVIQPDALGLKFKIEGRRLPKRCSGVSIAFTPRRWRIDRRRELCIVTRADLTGLALLTPPEEPAYPGLKAKRLSIYPCLTACTGTIDEQTS
jgi:phage head maturation protease